MKGDIVEGDITCGVYSIDGEVLFDVEAAQHRKKDKIIEIFHFLAKQAQLREKISGEADKNEYTKEDSPHIQPR